MQGDGGARRAADDAVLDAAVGPDAGVVEDDLGGARLGVLGCDGVGVERAADAGYVGGEGDGGVGEDAWEEVAQGVGGGGVGVAVLGVVRTGSEGWWGGECTVQVPSQAMIRRRPLPFFSVSRWGNRCSGDGSWVTVTGSPTLT